MASKQRLVVEQLETAKQIVNEALMRGWRVVPGSVSLHSITKSTTTPVPQTWLKTYMTVMIEETEEEEQEYSWETLTPQGEAIKIVGQNGWKFELGTQVVQRGGDITINKVVGRTRHLNTESILVEWESFLKPLKILRRWAPALEYEPYFPHGTPLT